jgi:hypothetical protein
MGKGKGEGVYYMHTIAGMPASFCKDQICYAVFFGPPNKLCRNLAQIRRERRQTIKWRKEQGLDNDVGEYGHCRFVLP